MLNGKSSSGRVTADTSICNPFAAPDNAHYSGAIEIKRTNRNYRSFGPRWLRLNHAARFPLDIQVTAVFS